MENNRKIFNFHFFMTFYFLVNKGHRNTYTQQILEKSNQSCGNYKRKHYEQ